MQHRILGKTGLSVSIISFGGVMMNGMESANANRIVAEAVERGVNYFDVAPIYGNAQYVLGPALAPYRKKVFLACKSDRRTADEVWADLEESFRALHTDYFDVYQLHSLDKPADIETTFGPGGAMEALLRAKEKGYVRHIGFTCHHDEAALSIMDHHDFETMLFPINYAFHLLKDGGSKPLAVCKEKNMGVIAIKALAKRNYAHGEASSYPKSWYLPIHDDPAFARMALNYTLSQDVTTAVSPGYAELLLLMLDIIEAQGGKPQALTDDELTMVKNAASQVGHISFY